MSARSLALATAAAAAAVLLAAPHAGAHALLRSSDPGAGARLEQPPRVITLRFTEAPAPTLSTVEVLDETGRDHVTGRPRPAPGRPNVVVGELGELPRGTFTVSWKVVSRVDGHATTGAFTFGVGETPRAAAASGDGPAEGVAALEVFGRWVLLSGLVLLVGAGTVGLLIPPSGRGGLQGIGLGGLGGSIVGLLLLAEAQRRAAGVSVSALAETVVGRAQLWRAGAILVADLGVLGARRARLWWWVALVGAAAAMLVHVAAGHAGAPEPLRWLDVGAQWLHLVAAGVWLGGLVALLASLRGTEGPAAVSATRRFSTVAGITLFLVAATGVLRALDEIERFGQLFSTGYGRAVLAKVAALLALAALGASNRYRHIPAAAFDRLRRTGRAEVAVGAVTLAVAALLAGLPPPAADIAGAAAPPESVVVAGSDFATTARARLEAVPGVPGTNSFVVALTDYDTGEPVDARSVSLSFRYLEDPGLAGSELRLRERAPGRYEARGGNLALPGRWDVTLLAEAGLEPLTIPLELATRCPVRTERRPGRPPVHTVDLGKGRSLQAYVEPRREGRNRVHLTFFAAGGAELEVPGRVGLEATATQGRVTPFQVQRFSPGHFVADGRLASGVWRFEVSAPRGSPPLLSCFEEEIAR